MHLKTELSYGLWWQLHLDTSKQCSVELWPVFKESALMRCQSLGRFNSSCSSLPCTRKPPRIGKGSIPRIIFPKPEDGKVAYFESCNKGIGWSREETKLVSSETSGRPKRLNWIAQVWENMMILYTANVWWHQFPVKICESKQLKGLSREQEDTVECHGFPSA